MSWSTTHLSTGSRDRNILHHDIRTEKAVNKFVGHKSEVCGLKWSPDDRQLGSGGNDNLLCLWELRASRNPVLTFSDHTAAVKAIAWSPHQHGLLASGGGTADRHIRSIYFLYSIEITLEYVTLDFGVLQLVML